MLSRARFAPTGRAGHNASTHARSPTIGRRRASLRAFNRQQKGDPRKGAALMRAAAWADMPPQRLALGGDATDGIRRKVAQVTQNLSPWKSLPRDTEIEAEAAV